MKRVKSSKDLMQAFLDHGYVFSPGSYHNGDCMITPDGDYEYMKIFTSVGSDMEDLSYFKDWMLEDIPNPDIGKLCKFWDDKHEPKTVNGNFGILKKITPGPVFSYVATYGKWKHYRPLTPEDLTLTK